MLILNMCDFFSHTKDWLCGQTVLADFLNLESLGSEQKGSVVTYDKYINSAGFLNREISRTPNCKNNSLFYFLNPPRLNAPVFFLVQDFSIFARFHFSQKSYRP